MNEYQEIIRRLEAGEACSLETRFKDRSGLIAESMTRRLTEVVPTTDPKGRTVACVTEEQDGEYTVVREPMLPQERLIVLGAGHIALPVCQFGAACGFEVCVIDDRPDFANRARFHEAAQVIR